MKRLFINSLLFIIAIFLLYRVNYAQVISHDVSVSAFIGGEYFFSLYGYTSPDAQVSMSSLGIMNETKSDSTGYFLFKDKPTSLYHQDICLSAEDTEGRISTPICIPPIPRENNIRIGPVLLPPTISLNNGAFFIGEEPILTGQTIPKSNINLSLFTDDKKNVNFIANRSFIKQVEAFTMPKIELSSDQKGKFSIALSSSQSKYYRMFAQSLFQDSISPKSNTLHMGILPFWIYLLRLFGFLWSALQGKLLDFIILSQIVSVVLFFIIKFLRPLIIPHKKHFALALRPAHELAVEQAALMKYEAHPLMKK